MATVLHELSELPHRHLIRTQPELTHRHRVQSLVVFTVLLRGRTTHPEAPAWNPAEFHTRDGFRPHSCGFLFLTQSGQFLLTLALALGLGLALGFGKLLFLCFLTFALLLLLGNALLLRLGLLAFQSPQLELRRLGKRTFGKHLKKKLEILWIA